MLVETIAKTLHSNQYIYSVDPGYVTSAYGYNIPITSKDGASRIIDPIIKMVEKKLYWRKGAFLKDYREYNYCGNI